MKLECWYHAHKSPLLASVLSKLNPVLSSRPVSLRSELLIGPLVRLQIVDGKYCLQTWTADVNKYVGISDSRKNGYPKMGGWG
jgi:hypothetical protein